MTIEAIGSIGAINTMGSAGEAGFLPPAQPLPGAQPLAGSEFGTWFNQQIAQVNGQLNGVEREMQIAAVGGTQSLHQFMIHMEEAKLSFQLLAQVRNRLLESYQEVMRMQV